MKETLLRYVLLAVFATVAVSGYGDDKVDYAKIETLVTNRLVILGKRVMVYNYLKSTMGVKVTLMPMAEASAAAIREHSSAMAGSKEQPRARGMG